MERQSNKADIEQCRGITVKSSKTPDMNVNTSFWSKRKHNELKSTSSPDAQSLFSMTENDSDGNAEKSKRYSVILVYHMLAIDHSLRIIQDMEMGAAWINWFKM